MGFYKFDGSSDDIKCLQYISEGTQGKIFRLEDNLDVCFKEYSQNTLDNWCFDMGNRFNKKMFDYFRDDFGNDNFCNLYDLYYDKKLENVIGYTMKYYEECIDNILVMPIDYILDNYSLIYDLVVRLTNDCIRVVDMNPDNVINTSDKMVVIDYDKYYIDNGVDNETLDYINKSALIYTFKGIFVKALRKYGIDVDGNLEIKNMVNRLFTVNTSPLVLKCKMRGYNKGIDYFIK